MIEKNTHFFIMAGEQSGDLHAAHLMQALKSKNSNYKFTGVAGPLMRTEGIVEVLPMEKFAVMGFSDVIKAFPSLYKQFYQVRDFILKNQPEVVIFVDYPGFNLRMAKALRKKGYKGKLVHYICPSVWAWGKKRIEHMASTLDLLLTIYPFESESFSHTTLPVEYVGNPLQEYISKHSYNKECKKLFPSDSKRMISIFPGSRRAEICRNLPKQLQAAALFQKKHPETAFGISCSNPIHQPLIQEMVTKTNLNHTFAVPKEYTYELMKHSHSAIAKSGTVTLELALHLCPTVVVYELSKLNYFIAKFIVRLKLPHYCIVNILNRKQVFPELIAHGFEPKNVAKHLDSINAGNERAACLEDCQATVLLFQSNMASEKAALCIRNLLT